MAGSLYTSAKYNCQNAFQNLVCNVNRGSCRSIRLGTQCLHENEKIPKYSGTCITAQQSLVRTSDISIRTKSIRKQSISPLRFAKKKNKDFSLFRLLFGSWLMLGLWSYSNAYEDPSVAGLTSFIYFACCFVLILMFKCESGLRETGYCNLSTTSICLGVWQLEVAGT